MRQNFKIVQIESSQREIMDAMNKVINYFFDHVLTFFHILFSLNVNISGRGFASFSFSF